MIYRLCIFCRQFRGFIVDECGSTAVEYAVMSALIIVVCASVVSSVGNAAYESFWKIAEGLH